jgi:23S rRNA (adenine2503-C2)-methyltransferase
MDLASACEIWDCRLTLHFAGCFGILAAGFSLDKERSMQKVNLLDLSPAELRVFLAGLGEPPYRAAQILDWLYRRGAADFAQMTNLPLNLREKLPEVSGTGLLRILSEQAAPDGTRKLLFALTDGHGVETVVLPYEYGFSVCASTQVGCRWMCGFCASGLSGFVRNLQPAEIMAQVVQVKNNLQSAGKALKSIVLMGTGEPLDNWDATVAFLRAVRDPELLAMSLRHVTLSTVGLPERIRALAKFRWPVTLAVSLHAAENALRDTIMPVNRRHPLPDLLAACDYYAEKTGRRITYEYIMLREVNDSEEQARKLSVLMRGRLCHVNLIAMNSVQGLEYRPSEEAAVRRFAEILAEERISTTVRRRLGAEIAAACGQLRNTFLE